MPQGARLEPDHVGHGLEVGHREERAELERAEVSNLREGVRRDREAFEKEVATLRELAQKVNEESVRVREAARVSEQEVAVEKLRKDLSAAKRATRNTRSGSSAKAGETWRNSLLSRSC
mgnify:CR=1 FL=1